MLKNIPQNLVRLNCSAYDFSQVVKTFTKILAYQIPGELHSQSVLYTVDSFQCTAQSLVMADVAYHYIILRQVGQGSEVHQLLLEHSKSFFLLG